MVAAFSVCVVLLLLDGVVRINCDIRFLDLVIVLVPLAAVIVVLVYDQVLRAGALSPTVGIACACRLLRTSLFVNI